MKSEDRFMSIVIFGKLKGTYDRSNKTYYSDRTNKHWFRKYNGLGLSYSLIQRLRKMGCEYVQFNYKRKDGGEDLYHTYIDKFVEYGNRHRFTEHDLQFILAKQYFNIETGGR